MPRSHNNSNNPDTQKAPYNNTRNPTTNPRPGTLPPLLIKSPQARHKLRDCNQARSKRMRRERQIIYLHRRRKPMMSLGILSSDLRRVYERRIRDKVCEEADHVYGGEIDCGSGCGTSTEVEDWLRVEGEGPAEGVDPAED